VGDRATALLADRVFDQLAGLVEDGGADDVPLPLARTQR
jgi:hypothetical protein